MIQFPYGIYVVIYKIDYLQVAINFEYHKIVKFSYLQMTFTFKFCIIVVLFNFPKFLYNIFVLE